MRARAYTHTQPPRVRVDPAKSPTLSPPPGDNCHSTHFTAGEAEAHWPGDFKGCKVTADCIDSYPEAGAGAGRGWVRRVEEVLVSSFQIMGSEPHSLTEVAQPASPRAWGV